MNVWFWPVFSVSARWMDTQFISFLLPPFAFYLSLSVSANMYSIIGTDYIYRILTLSFFFLQNFIVYFYFSLVNLSLPYIFLFLHRDTLRFKIFLNFFGCSHNESFTVTDNFILYIDQFYFEIFHFPFSFSSPK